MGYGFLEFESAAQAQEVLKRKQGVAWWSLWGTRCSEVLVDGHALQLQHSQRGSKAAKMGAKKSKQGEA